MHGELKDAALGIGASNSPGRFPARLKAACRVEAEKRSMLK
jgi:hypothetical protein